jgi:hypothetical protein
MEETLLTLEDLHLISHPLKLNKKNTKKEKSRANGFPESFVSTTNCVNADTNLFVLANFNAETLLSASGDIDIFGNSNSDFVSESVYIFGITDFFGVESNS